MRGEAHAAAGALIGFTVASVPGMIVGGISALLPDLDHPYSKMGRKMPVISWLFSGLGHRTFTHSIVGGIVFGVLAYLGLSYVDVGYLIIPAMLGYLSHIVLDIMTMRGVQLLWPKRDFIGLRWCKSNGVISVVLTVAFGLVLAMMFLG